MKPPPLVEVSTMPEAPVTVSEPVPRISTLPPAEVTPALVEVLAPLILIDEVSSTSMPPVAVMFAPKVTLSATPVTSTVPVPLTPGVKVGLAPTPVWPWSSSSTPLLLRVTPEVEFRLWVEPISVPTLTVVAPV